MRSSTASPKPFDPHPPAAQQTPRRCKPTRSTQCIHMDTLRILPPASPGQIEHRQTCYTLSNLLYILVASRLLQCVTRHLTNSRLHSVRDSCTASQATAVHALRVVSMPRGAPPVCPTSAAMRGTTPLSESIAIHRHSSSTGRTCHTQAFKQYRQNLPYTGIQAVQAELAQAYPCVPGLP
jgi:hypothetical protein